MNRSAEVITEIIQERRSVFPNQFIPGKQVPKQIIEQILENANRAPTHKLTEPWRFRVYSGMGLQRLAEFQAASYQAVSGDRFKADKYEKLLKTAPSCSHVIAIGMKRHAASRLPEMEEIAAVACAVENIWLSVQAFGLGGYWSTGATTYNDTAKSFFGLEDQDLMMGFFYLGYVQVPSPLSRRRPVAEKTVWVDH